MRIFASDKNADNRKNIKQDGDKTRFIVAKIDEFET